jgi:hypothetical protein
VTLNKPVVTSRERERVNEYRRHIGLYQPEKSAVKEYSNNQGHVILLSNSSKCREAPPQQYKQGGWVIREQLMAAFHVPPAGNGKDVPRTN